MVHVVVRNGGDELVWTMPHLSAPEARERFERIAAALAAADAKRSIMFGLAQGEPSERLQNCSLMPTPTYTRRSGHANG